MQLRRKEPQQQQQQVVEQPYRMSIVFYNEQKQKQLEGTQKFKVIWVKKGDVDHGLIVQQDLVYGGQIVDQQMMGIGRVYITSFDAYYNTNKFVYEGQFNNNEIDGQGTTYYGKSKNKKIEGRFHNQTVIEKYYEFNEDGSIVEPNKIIKQQIQLEDDRNGQSKGFRIKSGKVQQHQQIQPQKHKNDKWSKYDSTLSKDDQTNLLVEKGITSSIMSAYSNHLNFLDSEIYFSLQGEQQIKQYKRTLVLPIQQFEDEQQILQAFMEYEYLGGQFWLIYSKILCIVNQNGHWVLIQVSFEDGVKMKIYDPLSKKKSIFYFQTCKTVWNVFDVIVKHYELTIQWKQKDIYVMECPQQTVPQDSGVFVCLYCKHIVKDQPIEISQEDVKTMRELELFNLIKQ